MQLTPALQLQAGESQVMKYWGWGDSRLLISYRPIFERPWSQQRHQLGFLHAFWNCIETRTRAPPLMTRKGRISKSSETGCGWRDSQSATVGWVQFSATFDQSNFHKNVLLVVYAFPFCATFTLFSVITQSDNITGRQTHSFYVCY